MAILNIPITKAGKTIAVDTDADLNEEVFTAIVAEGLKVFLNKGLTGDKYKTKDLEGEDLDKAKAAVFAKAQENFADLKAGKLRRTRAAATTADGKKVPAKVLTEARRLAKEVVKDEIRAAGLRPSQVEASEITKLANALIAEDPTYIEQATANIAAREKLVVVSADEAEVKAAAKAKLAALGFAGESPKLVAAAAKAKADRKSTLSAKQAGLPKAAPRKGSQPSA